VVGLLWLGGAVAAAAVVLPREARGTFLPAMLIGDSDHVQLDVAALSGGVGLAINGIRAGGLQWLSAPSPLFEVAVGECVWNSLGQASGGLPIQVSSASSGAGQTNVDVSLGGCADVPQLRMSLKLSCEGRQITMTGTLSADVLPGSGPNGWFGPFMLGTGTPPVFPIDAHVALLRSRFDASIGGPTPYVREEAFVVGNDGIFYGSFVENAGPWTAPAPLYSTAARQNRFVFRPGSAFAAVRRNDRQTDLFAVASGGPHGGRVMTVFRVGSSPLDPWSTPIPLTTEGPTFLAGAPVAALNLHEEMNTSKNEVEVYVAGNGDGRLYTLSEHDNGAFGAPRFIAGGRLIDFRGVPPRPRFEACPLPTDRPVHLAALARNRRQRDLFFIDGNGQLCTTFRVRATNAPPDTASEWERIIPLGNAGTFPPGAPVAAAHGAGNGEHVFAVGHDGNVYWARQVDDGPWRLSPIPLPATFAASSSANIAAARRTAREIVVAYVVAGTGAAGGRVMELRWDDVQQRWTGPFDTRLSRGTPDRRVALSLRDGNQLDVLGVALSDSRLWTAGDSRGRSHVRMVLPKLVFRGDALASATGMVPVEIAGSGAIPGESPWQGTQWELGMPYRRDGRAQEFGLPQSMNMMQLAHITKHNASFFVMDASPPIAIGGSQAQLTISSSRGSDEVWQEVTGFWTADLRQEQAIPLPTIVFGGYAGNDWHPSVDAYLARQPRAQPAVQTPSWLRQAGAIYTFGGGGAGGIYLDIDRYPWPGDFDQGDLKNYATRGTGTSAEPFAIFLPRRLLREAQAAGTDVVYLFDYWETTSACRCVHGPAGAYYHCKGDYAIREDLGGLASLQRGIDAVHQADPPGRVILYVEPFLWGEGSRAMDWSDLYMARRPPDGRPWLPFAKSVPLSYAHSDWQDRFVQIAEHLIRDTHADGLFLDSGAWRINEHVETKDEVVRASPREHAAALLELARRVRAAIRRINPEAVVLSETTAGPIVDEIDGGVSADLSFELFRMRDSIDGRIVATPTRYGIPRANIFSAGPNVWGRDQPVLHDLNQIYAAGHNLALAGTSMSAGRPYLRRLVRIRRAFANALVEGAQTDLLVRPDLIARRYLGASQEAITVINLTGDHASAILGKPGGGPLVNDTTYCDVFDDQTYRVAGGLIAVSVPPAPSNQTCAYDVPAGSRAVCGLRVLVRGTCPAH